MPRRYQAEADFNGAVAGPPVVKETWAAWRKEITFADQFAREHDLGFAGRDSEGEPISVRVLQHAEQSA